VGIGIWAHLAACASRDETSPGPAMALSAQIGYHAIEVGNVSHRAGVRKQISYNKTTKEYNKPTQS